MVTDLLLMGAPDFSGWSSDPTRPDYASPSYREQAPRWQLVHDARGATEAMRLRAEVYLPRFEAESITDWTTRVRMTFANDHYATTLVEHVGLVFSEAPALGDDVPARIQELAEDIDGEGNHIDVFLQSAFESGLHLGHCVLYTDYPVTDAVKTRGDAKAAKIRPYATLYSAADVLSWRTAVVGGVCVIIQIVFREKSTTEAGAFGVEERILYREVKQEVFYDEITERATGLGSITWRTFTKDAGESDGFTVTGSGTIIGPDRIPARIVYGGEKIGVLHSKPHLYGLALSNIEETQTKSDYRNNMHRCNVLTPIFIGRQSQATGDGATVQMGQGIDIPVGGDAKFLEPTGAALGSTRQHLQDIRAEMRRQGATIDDEAGKVMTATEAAIYARQRNAKLLRAARSLQDAAEGMLADFAAFMGLSTSSAVKSGGSLKVNQEFSGPPSDPDEDTKIQGAFDRGAITLLEYRTYLATGQLPETFNPANIRDLLAQGGGAE